MEEIPVALGKSPDATAKIRASSRVDGDGGSFAGTSRGTTRATRGGVEEPLVLVVDDYDDVRDLYVHRLEEVGFRVVSARNGAEAVALAKQRPPAAIVMDLQMPVMDGWDAIREIRALLLEERPYILAVTAHIGDGSRAQAYDAGADDFVAKPLDPAVLCTILRAALRART